MRTIAETSYRARSAVGRTTIIVVHYGDLSPTLDTLDNLAGFGADIVVVANDRTPRPATLTSQVSWVVPSRNLGYGEAIRAASNNKQSDVFVLLNTDIVLPRETFDKCIDALSVGRVGISAPVLRHDDGRLQSGAARISRWRKAPQVLVDPGPNTVPCLWVTGAIMFVRGEVLHSVGMDGAYFLGAEDVDFCVRAGRQGWKVVCCGEVSAVHHGSAVISGPRWTYYTIRNRVWLNRANFGPLSAVLSWTASAVSVPRIFLADLVKRKDMTSSRLALLALRDALRRKPRPSEGPLPDEPRPASIMTW